MTSLFVREKFHINTYQFPWQLYPGHDRPFCMFCPSSNRADWQAVHHQTIVCYPTFMIFLVNFAQIENQMYVEYTILHLWLLLWISNTRTITYAVHLFLQRFFLVSAIGSLLWPNVATMFRSTARDVADAVQIAGTTHWYWLAVGSIDASWTARSSSSGGDDHMRAEHRVERHGRTHRMNRWFGAGATRAPSFSSLCVAWWLCPVWDRWRGAALRSQCANCWHNSTVTIWEWNSVGVVCLGHHVANNIVSHRRRLIGMMTFTKVSVRGTQVCNVDEMWSDLRELFFFVQSDSENSSVLELAE